MFPCLCTLGLKQCAMSHSPFSWIIVLQVLSLPFSLKTNLIAAPKEPPDKVAGGKKSQVVLAHKSRFYSPTPFQINICDGRHSASPSFCSTSLFLRLM